MFVSTTKFRVKSPDIARRIFSIQFNNGVKWQTYSSPELDAINHSFKNGVLTKEQAKERVDRILVSLYEERDRLTPSVVVLPGNFKIVEDFIKKTYTPQKLLRMADRSFESEKYAFDRAITDLGDVPVDGDVQVIQAAVDDKFKDDRGAHRKRVTSINRLRKWLKLELILHLRDVAEDTVYITEAQLKEALPHIKNEVTRKLAAFLYYTGLRLGEAFAVTAQSVQQTKDGMLIKVTKQMLPDKKLSHTKTRTGRKAFVIPGGEKHVEDWIAVADKEKYREGKHNERIKEALLKVGIKDSYLHCLRHSYCIHLVANGCTIDWVAQSAGHSREVCERYYGTHQLTDDAVRLMAMTLKGNKQSNESSR